MTVLPPVHLGINIDTDIFATDASQGGGELLTDSHGFSPVKLDQAPGSGQETPAGDEATRDAKYYHNALSCVILGVVVMIILFFVCKFLNDLQVSPRSGRGQKRTGYGYDGLVESVPISLKGHTQVCMNPILLEQFLFECRKTKTKVTSLTNHNSRKQSNEPIRARSKYMSPVPSAGKRVRISHDWFWSLLIG